jgi:hypothetical protein
MAVHIGTVTANAVVSGRGLLRSVHIDPLAASGSATITFYDSLTAGTGTVIGEFRIVRIATTETMGGHGSFEIDQLFNLGLSYSVTGSVTFTVATALTL